MRLTLNHGPRRPRREHAACGVGLLAARDGVPRYCHLERALAALVAVEHRGAVSADGRSSDGAGIMLDIPWELLARAPQSVALATLFVDRAYPREQVLDVFERTFAVFELEINEYREVPTRPGVLGRDAAQSQPTIVQAIIARPPACRTEASFEARLYHAKQTTRTRLHEHFGPQPRRGEALFFTSLSCRTVVYKALTRAAELSAFYPDLLDLRFKTRFALIHRRFSTNSRTSWDKAQPFRLVAHNGEINTIAGNRSWSNAREQALGLAPGELLSHREISDSGNLNEHAEALRVRSSIPQIEDILAITMPVAGVRNEFYSFWGRAMEPWDGPALIAWADGRALGARLDRNGFRPARWALAEDLFVLGSEAGMFGLDPQTVEAQGILASGSGVKIELESGEVHFRDPSRSRENEDARFDPRLSDFPDPLPEPAKFDLGSRAALFGLDEEQLHRVLLPMIHTGHEAIGSMGNTARPAVFSTLPRSFYDYFFQTVAQVTNPPLDYLRERSVTDLSTYLGKRPNIFAAKELLPQTPGLRLSTPVLSLAQMAFVRSFLATTPKSDRPAKPRLRGVEVDICIDAEALAADPGGALERALETIASETLAAAAHGRGFIVLSDRGASPSRPPIPSLLALRAAVVALNDTGQRLESALVLDTGDVRSTHQLACAIGFGATAVCPYLALSLAREHAPGTEASEGSSTAEQAEQAEQRMRSALELGLLEIMSKMGISVVRSYQSAKLFSSLGLSQGLLEDLFPGLDSPIGGLGLAQIGRTIERGLAAAIEAGEGLLASPHLFAEHLGNLRGEAHAMTTARAHLLHRSAVAQPVRGLRVAGSTIEDPWADYLEAGEHEAPVTLRELLELRPLAEPLPIERVEARAGILSSFGAGGMSFGAISAQAQRDIFVAMDTIGGRSNSGEGGENPWYFVDGTRATTKQVASGRFGVDAEYLASAEEIEIKIAQGANPGEGGQLMGIKVDAAVAAARRANPGVSLISPAPLHDIYSIEDLKQLIYELRAVNPWARICVKLASGVDIGTVAVGVAKAGADVIQVSGGSGGTGAASSGSMKHAGLPWELGLAEVHRELVVNGLRGRVTLRVDGGLQRGFDLIVAAALGAEEFGFGKLVLIAAGCVMARVCENNQCPRGIATHDPKYLSEYRGSPERIVAVLERLADEVRAQLAQLGVASLADLLGRTDVLAPAQRQRERIAATGLDLSALLAGARGGVAERLPASRERISGLERQLLSDLLPKLEQGEQLAFSYAISNTDRAVLGRVSGELAQRAHSERMRSFELDPRTLERPNYTCYLPKAGSAKLHFEGSAGQGFACFLVRGLDVVLAGEANDGLAKGMSGGAVTVVPHPRAGFVAEDNVLIGNCALYGATGGSLYLRGRAGDRFAVRNSGAEAVVEGVGMHACEYMTRGRVAILGPVGANLGAGMSGGVVYLHRSEARRVNTDTLELSSLDAEDQLALQALLERHLERTASHRATKLLDDWARTQAEFCCGRAQTSGEQRQTRGDSTAGTRAGERARVSLAGSD